MLQKRMLIEIDEKTGKVADMDFKTKTDAEGKALQNAMNTLLIAEANMIGFEIAAKNSDLESLNKDVDKIIRIIRNAAEKRFNSKNKKKVVDEEDEFVLPEKGEDGFIEIEV